MEESAAAPRRLPHLGFSFALLGLALCCVSALSLAVGRGDLSDPSLRATLLELRAQRLLAALLAGAALAVAGVLVQGLFRNPLASPSVLGTSAGASLGGRLALIGLQVMLSTGRVPWLSPELLLPLGSVLGALGALGLLLLVTRVRDDLVVLLLTGFLMSSLFLSLEGFVTSLALERWELSRAVLSFALGDVSGAGARQIALSTPLVLIGCVLGWTWARPLDLMLSGEDEARSLGVELASVRRWVVVWTAVLTAAAVALGGNVGFVGLVVPHVLRPLVGSLHRRLLPAAALGGGTFVVLCDVVSRVAPGRTEIPLGVITGLIGAPTFLWLLLQHRRESYAF
ncbi:MAG TPA: iron ABC transporter permease [Polyangiaceae bacterium]|nr:iron ABC transporter permease [Polyangiaceae bacterium]